MKTFFIVSVVLLAFVLLVAVLCWAAARYERHRELLRDDYLDDGRDEH